MDKDKAKKIIEYVVSVTESRWRNFQFHWKDIDQVFIQRGLEQGGFESRKFTELLEKQDIFSIEKIGKILDNNKEDIKYNRLYAGGLNSPFYEKMKNGVYGIEGKKFYMCVRDFEGRRGYKFWQILWYMLVCCNYLKKNYQDSFSYFLKKKYAEFKNKKMVSDDEFLKISSEEWEKFTSLTKPWNELYGIGENVFDFIIGDIVEANFAKDAYKLDSANCHFLKVTGINKLIKRLERNEVKKFLKMLSLPYTIREINRGIYTYCSETEANSFGFCRKEEKCKECEVNTLCEKNF